MGLNDTYKSLKAQILLIKPFSSLNEAHAFIQQEEKRRQISFDNPTDDSMAMLAKGNFSVGKSYQGNPRKNRYYCTFCKIPSHSFERCRKANPNKAPYFHCQIPGHSIDRCYKLHGHPPGHKLERMNKTTRPSINVVTTLMPFNHE